jgi:predicted RNase H-like nuclease (RuvC/YqgF family)
MKYYRFPFSTTKETNKESAINSLTQHEDKIKQEYDKRINDLKSVIFSTDKRNQQLSEENKELQNHIQRIMYALISARVSLDNYNNTYQDNWLSILDGDIESALDITVRFKQKYGMDK